MSKATKKQRIVIIKLGGSSITDKALFETINKNALRWVHKYIAQNIHSSFLASSSVSSLSSSSKSNIENKPAFIIIHGAGSFGHQLAKKFGLKGESEPPSNQTMSSSSSSFSTNHYMTGLANTRNSVKMLNNIVVSSLLSSPVSETSGIEDEEDTIITSINAVGISPCINIPSLQAYGGSSYSASLLIQSIKEALQVGLVPVIHGDAGLYGFFDGDCEDENNNDNVQKMRSGILSGDTLVELIATSPLWDTPVEKDKNENNAKESKLRQYIDQVVFLTDVNGVFTKDPNAHPNEAKLLKQIIINPTNGDIHSIEVKNDDNDGQETKISSLEIHGSSHGHDVTGGLKTKLNSAVVIAKKGIQVRIVKCCSKTAENVLNGSKTDLGTTIMRKD